MDFLFFKIFYEFCLVRCDVFPPQVANTYYNQQLSVCKHADTRTFIMPPFEEEGVYCFANVGRSVGMSVGRPNGFR